MFTQGEYENSVDHLSRQKYSSCRLLEFHFSIGPDKSRTRYGFPLGKQGTPNSVLVLSDVRCSKMSPESFKIAKEGAAKIAPFARKRAMVGVTAVQKAFLKSLNALFPQKGIQSFDDIEKAKQWLIA